MQQLDRIQLLHRQFNSSKRAIHIDELARMCECSAEVVKRTIKMMRELWNAPIFHDKARKGYRYSINDDHVLHPLPGLWLTSDELQALASVLAITESLNQGLMSDALKNIESTLHKLLLSKDIKPENFTHIIQYIAQGHSLIDNTIFNPIVNALLTHKQLTIRYTNYQQTSTQREVSPLKLVNYRQNWYLDAYCEKRHGLRTFHLSRITFAALTNTPARRIDPEQQAKHFTPAYGIFAGPATDTASLIFRGAAAFEVAKQEWHPEQIGQWQGDAYHLNLPFGEPTELVRDILQFGPDVEVLAPESLQELVKARLKAAIERYG